MKETNSISLEPDDWMRLQDEADELEISRNELIRKKLLEQESEIISNNQDADAEMKKEEVIWKKLRNTHKVIQIEESKINIEIKKRMLTYQETFGTLPSQQAQNAIHNGIKKLEPIPKIYSDYSKENENYDVPKYLEASKKSYSSTHDCEVKKTSITLDRFKNVFCPYCGATI